MDKTGIIYIMTTSVKGLIKIGKTDNYKARMAILEQNGYWNVSGLHQFYAVRVKDYDEKEKLIHTVFSKSQVSTSELFALDKNIAKEMLESFDGVQIYPEIIPPDGGPPKPPRTPTAKNLTFKLLSIPVGSELVYKDNPSITVKTVDDKSSVEYEGQIYTMSGFVTHIKNGGSWQGGEYLLYNGKKLTKLRKEMESNN